MVVPNAFPKHFISDNDGLCFVCLFLRWIFLLSKWLQSRVFESGAKFMTLEQVQVHGKEEHKERPLF